MRYPLGLLLLLTAILIGACDGPPEQSAVAPNTDGPVYRIGYMICNNKEETLGRFAPLTALLSQRLRVRLEPLAIDTLEFTSRINELDFTHTNSLLYIMLHRFHAVEVLAVEKRGELGDRSRGIIAALKKSGIETLDDLRGKSMIFGPMLAPTSYLSQLYVLKQNGIDIDRDLAIYNFPRGSYKHEKVIYGVYFGRYDAGAFPYYDYEIMIKQGKIDEDDFTVLAEGPLIPYCNFAYTQKVDPDFAKRFQQALLAITSEDTVEIDGQRVRVLERAQLDGFSAAKDSDFDIVRQMAKETNMPPYQRY